ncbi:nucleic acid-binding, OB-fold protein [Artemisia annua]|uniref:Nucleic acid-binding, OB-fold protein n=1 Tax=Artemisia annua TaxID=35608 RepID=A0A2U1LK04_ARTAN|nr:nucleic acid-binding, OB-fold protein [Artemisia annua]
MAVLVSGYINDLSAVKDNITLRVRVLRSWTQVIYNKPHVKNLEMILMDENVSRWPIWGYWNELNCTLWGVFAQQFNDFLEATVDHGKIMIVLSLAMMKSWDDVCPKRLSRNKNVLFNAAQPIEQAEFKEVEEYRLRLFSRDDAEPSENTASRISAGSKFSTKDDFLNKYPVKNIVELLDVEKNIASIIVGTIIAIQEEEGWWYLGCRKCSKKVVKESEFVDLDDDSKGKMSVTSDQWRCTKCNEIVKVINQCRSAYQLCEKYGLKSADQQVFPKEITELVGKRFAFKVSIDEYNQKKMLPVFTVLRLSADVDILSALTSSVTPMKEAEATSSKCVGISALDLESQTDETVTPTNVLKSTATSPPAKTSSGKRPSDDGPSTECSKTKRQIVDIKMEKNP